MDQKQLLAEAYSFGNYSETTILWSVYQGTAPKRYNISVEENESIKQELKETNLDKFLVKLRERGHRVELWGSNIIQNDKKTWLESGIFFIDQKTAIFLNDESLTDDAAISFLYSGESTPELYNEVKDILLDCQEVVPLEVYPTFTLVSSKLEFTTMKIKSKKQFDIPAQFNDSFLPVDQTIQKWIINDNTNGIAILHGMKGTGKSSYIEYLISQYRDISFLYVTKETIEGILANSLYDLIRTFNKSVVIFEDCEQLIKKRTEYVGNSFISTLLNMSDGILASSCICKFILTFNARITEIDDALLRKGRCVANYEFTQLEKGKTVALLDKLGKKYDAVPKEGLTLADIYNYDEVSCEKRPTKKIGFTQ